MRKRRAITVIAFVACCTATANAAPPLTPVITRVVADLATATVFVEGQDFDDEATAYGAKKRPRLGRCWSSLPSSLRLCRLRCSSSSSRSLAG